MRPAASSLKRKTQPAQDPGAPSDRVTRKAVAHVKVAAGSMKSAESKTVKKAKTVAKKQECIICANEKTIRYSFKVARDANSCEHWAKICRLCIAKLLKSKVDNQDLSNSELVCCQPNCDRTLNYNALSKTVTEVAFET